MKINISLRRFFFAICVLFTFSIGQMWGYDWSSSATIYFDNGNVNWSSVYLSIIKNDGGDDYVAQNLQMTRIGNTSYYYVTQGYNGYKSLVFRPSTSSWDNQSNNYGNGIGSNVVFTLAGNKNDAVAHWDGESVYLGSNSSNVYFINNAITSSTYTGTIYLRYGMKYWSIATPLTKVAGTEYLYKKTLDSDIAYEAFYIANASGWQSGNSIFQPWASQAWGDDPNGYKITGQTTAQRTAISGDLFIKPTTTGDNFESYCQYYNFSTSSSSGCTVTFSPSHGTITVEKYNNDAGTSTTEIGSGSSVLPTQIIAVSTTADTGYKLSGDLSVTNGTQKSVGVYYITGASVISATFSAKQCNLVLDYQTSAEGYLSSGSIDNAATLTATYDATMTALTGTMPSAKPGYKFQGFYTEANGGGTKYYNADGSSANLWSVDTESATTLYAYYEKAQIIALTLAAEIVGTETTDSITVTPTVSPVPSGTTRICWEVQYSDGTALETQPEGRIVTGNQYRFKAPTASASYKVTATLRTGDACDGGTELSSRTASFVVAGDHTVTIRYKYGDMIIAASTTATANPLNWSSEITAPDDIFGYSFQKWVSGDGVTINGAVNGESTSSTITIKAIYDGTLTAQYTKDNIIYFKNTLGWSNVYVNLLTGVWWNSSQGTGNQSLDPDKKNKQMSLVPGTTDVYYYEYGGTEVTNYVSFTDRSMPDSYGFSGTTNDPVRVCYPTIPNPANSQTEMAYFGFYNKTPMFVPASTYPGDLWNNSTARYYNSGYWTKYTPGTGYYLLIYDPNDDTKLIQRIEFTSSDDLIPMTATANLEANKTYKFEVEREEQTYYSNGGSMDYDDRYSQGVAWELYRPSTYTKTSFVTTAAGDYIFHLTYSGNQETHTNLDVWRPRIAAEYPLTNGDYRLVYSDAIHTGIKPSDVVAKINNGREKVSFFVRKTYSPVLRIQKATVSGDGSATWAEYPTPGTPTNQITGSIATAITQTGVYNFCLEMDENGDVTIASAEPYTGNYYIRVDCAGNTQWSNYRAEDHKMTYSEYAANKTGSEYTHYYMKFVDKSLENGKYKNVKFVIANDYSPCISDTLIQQTSDISPNHVDASGNLQVNANIRFMWDSRTNSLKRAYLAEGQSSGSYFLVLQGQENNIYHKDGNNVRLVPANNNGVSNDAIQFSDNQNWVYEATVKAKPGGRIKLYARYDAIDYYFYGDNNASFDAPHGVELISGSGDPELIRVIYDFKTDRLMAAWMPTDAEISTTQSINADIMLVRKHQESGQQINLTGSGKITTSASKKVYAVMQFNKYDLNNREKTGEHDPLSPGDQKSSYERHNYFISFPFDVKLGEVFGFGQVGTHWRIMYYDGLGRAQEGFFAERKTNWFMIDDTDSILHANQGYMLQLSPSAVAFNNSTTWANNLEQIELYFPAKDAITTIQLANVTLPALGDEYRCTRDLSSLYGGDQEANRTIKDSYWRCIGVPGFTSYEANAGEWTNFNWVANENDVPYLYEWVKTDNSLRVVTSSSFTFQPMHAYLVQNKNAIVWTSVAKPVVSAIAARKSLGINDSYEFRLEINQNSTLCDQTYIRLTNQEGVTANFDFGQDLSKELNSGKTNIYSFIGYEKAAANSLPISDQTTQVPVGVQIAADGEYTFSMPDGTSGVGVTLVDNETGARTNLSLVDYTVNLSAGTYDNRFSLEISAIEETPTDVEEIAGDGSQVNGARKVLIDGILYIVKDGKIFDARGMRVE